MGAYLWEKNLSPILHLLSSLLPFFSVCLCAGVGHVEVREQLVGSLLSFHCIGPKDRTQVFRFGS